MKKYFLGLLVLVGLISIGVFAQTTTSETASETMQVTTTHVESHPSQGDIRTIDGASATLVSSEDGLFVSLQTAELEEGHVYTMWVVVINNPEACEGSPCMPPDVIGNSDGTQSDLTLGDSIVYKAGEPMAFAAYVPAAELHQGWYGNGLTNPLGAEIHLVVNDHGEYISDIVTDMLSSYRGGCTDESLPPPFPESATSDGEEGPNACRLVQDAIFIQ
jgi:hypothetical protein